MRADLEVMLGTAPLQRAHVTCGTATEPEVSAHVHGQRPDRVQQHRVQELLGTHLGEFVREGDHQDGVHAGRGDEAELVTEREQLRRRGLRRDHLVGVAVEGDGDRIHAARASVCHGVGKQGLVAEVHAVEHADGDDRRAQPGHRWLPRDHPSTHDALLTPPGMIACGFSWPPERRTRRAGHPLERR